MIPSLTASTDLSAFRTCFDVPGVEILPVDPSELSLDADDVTAAELIFASVNLTA